jgi:4'-phosphopantetheinyl transferase
VSPEAVAEGAILDELAAMLDDEERARWRRFVFAGDRHDFPVSHGLVRCALARQAGVPPGAWTFETNRFGRPEIAGPAAGRGLRFSLSHTKGLVALAVAREREIGIDVEELARELPADVARSMFTSDELAAIGGLRGEPQHERSTELWTLKEAYAKARGLGLSLGFRGFSIDFGPQSGEKIKVASPAHDDGRQWQFELHRVSTVYCLALAYDASARGAAELRVVPLVARMAR